ncbi:hypothetical protein SY89_00629 [Halolamina pelagica]|uniref:Uncharacterized protein n=1 Tax=Halolamina pelagica TaxID=699431 RepID=A0A0P7GML0_9EURY|nr:hypothetical protein [Halolamina pelagica]KPN29909.1 hypothetical protein SY89_00629 [Halolamina pelagica]
MQRRALLVTLGLATAGCSALDSTEPAHTVTVYNVDSEVTREVTVRIENDAGETVFERTATFDAENEAAENVPFPESSQPETVFVTVNGTEFERDWPMTDCDGENWAGIEVRLRGGRDEKTTVALGTRCQHVTTTPS